MTAPASLRMARIKRALQSVRVDIAHEIADRDEFTPEWSILSDLEESIVILVDGVSEVSDGS